MPVSTRDPVNAVAKPTRYVAPLSSSARRGLWIGKFLRSSLEPLNRDLGASGTEMGLLTGFAFVLFFALASVPITRAADRLARNRGRRSPETTSDKAHDNAQLDGCASRS
jgi:hypothetical protein